METWVCVEGVGGVGGMERRWLGAGIVNELNTINATWYQLGFSFLKIPVQVTAVFMQGFFVVVVVVMAGSGGTWNLWSRKLRECVYCCCCW